ncbi:hypothetical protein K5M36_20555 [Chromobacterium vaccinii]|nr:hypothetical protein [Chromobacterium vaccinii]
MIKRYVSIYNKNTDELVDELLVSAEQAWAVLVSLYGDQPNDPDFYAEYPIDKMTAVGLLGEWCLTVDIANEDCVFYLTCG